MHVNSSEPSDIEIVRRIIKGDVNAFEHLMTKYGEVVSIIVKRHVPYDRVEEVVQDVFVRAFQSLPTFKKKNRFKQWLSTIAVRTCYDFWRKVYRSRELPISSLTERHKDCVAQMVAEQSNRSFSEHAFQKETREILDWALDRLSAEDRMVLELVYLEGLSVKEVAGLLGWSVANVKIRSFRSRKRLQGLLAGLTER
jgi:RNA polymerase sigma-70 factor (ECF subfamily)